MILKPPLVPTDDMGAAALFFAVAVGVEGIEAAGCGHGKAAAAGDATGGDREVGVRVEGGRGADAVRVFHVFPVFQVRVIIVQPCQGGGAGLEVYRLGGI